MQRRKGTKKLCSSETIIKSNFRIKLFVLYLSMGSLGFVNDTFLFRLNVFFFHRDDMQTFIFGSPRVTRNVIY